MTENYKENEIGCVWRREKGNTVYYSGVIKVNGETTNIVMFENNKKEAGSKQPDWRILVANRQPDNSSKPQKTFNKPTQKQNFTNRKPFKAFQKPKPQEPQEEQQEENQEESSSQTL